MKTTILVLIAAAVAGACGFAIGHSQAERQGEALALAHALEKTGLCANALNMLAGPENTTSVRMLDQQLRLALGNAERYSASASRIRTMIPNLVDALRRARRYAEGIGDRQLAQRTSDLERTIEQSLRQQRE